MVVPGENSHNYVENGGFLGFCGDFMGSYGMYPLVMTNSLLTGKSPCSMGKSTISMAIFHSYVVLPERANFEKQYNCRYPQGQPLYVAMQVASRLNLRFA